MSQYTVPSLPSISRWADKTTIHVEVKLADGLSTAEIHSAVADIVRRIEGDAPAAEDNAALTATGDYAAWLLAMADKWQALGRMNAAITARTLREWVTSDAWDVDLRKHAIAEQRGAENRQREIEQWLDSYPRTIQSGTCWAQWLRDHEWAPKGRQS